MEEAVFQHALQRFPKVRDRDYYTVRWNKVRSALLEIACSDSRCVEGQSTADKSTILDCERATLRYSVRAMCVKYGVITMQQHTRIHQRSYRLSAIFAR
jgi:hypothetical protein